MSQIKVSDLSFAYPGSYDNIFEHVSLTLDTDWTLGFIGRNGRGKTTFLRLLMGEYPYRGRISASVGFDYFPFPIENTGADARSVLLSVSDAEEWQLGAFAHAERAEGLVQHAFVHLQKRKLS